MYPSVEFISSTLTKLLTNRCFVDSQLCSSFIRSKNAFPLLRRARNFTIYVSKLRFFLTAVRVIDSNLFHAMIHLSPGANFSQRSNTQTEYPRTTNQGTDRSRDKLYWIDPIWLDDLRKSSGRCVASIRSDLIDSAIHWINAQWDSIKVVRSNARQRLVRSH